MLSLPQDGGKGVSASLPQTPGSSRLPLAGENAESSQPDHKKALIVNDRL
jgi:hypothetical protein